MTTKFQHLLAMNKRMERPSYMFFLDTETLTEQVSDTVKVENFRLACATYWQLRLKRDKDTVQYYHFKSITDVWDTIDGLVRDHTTLHVIAHYWSFDLQVLGRFGYLKQLGWELDFSYEKGYTVLIKLKKGSRKLVFVDNMNFFHCSIAVLGNNIKLPKRKMPAFTASDDDWFYYCERDVDIMLKAWQDVFSFLDAYELGSWKPTAASLSQSIYRHKFMKTPIYIHADPRVIKLERDSYHGARTEARKLGKFSGQDFYYLDVNAMYAAVMKLYEYPYNLRSYLRGASLKVLNDYIDKYAIIAEVELKTDEPIYAHKVKGKLQFPIGEFTEVLTTLALKYALQHDHIVSVGRIALYDRSRLFSDFVDFFYDARLKHKESGNTSFAVLDKLILNSSYGKWGQRNDDWEFVKTVPQQQYELWKVIDSDTKAIRTYRIHDGIMEMHKGYSEPFNTFVAIASEITTNARLYLYDLSLKIGDDHIYYYDTDGFIVDSQGHENVKELISDTKLGMLKVDKQDTEIEIRGLKDYRFGSYNRIKGVSLRATKVDDNTFDFWQKAKKGGKVYSSYSDKCAFELQRKQLKRIYDKGIVLPDATVKPLIITNFHNVDIIDYSEMESVYGYDATYKGADLSHQNVRSQSKADKTRDKLADMSPADRMAANRDKANRLRQNEARESSGWLGS